jgi:hypothetical protein
MGTVKCPESFEVIEENDMKMLCLIFSDSRMEAV